MNMQARRMVLGLLIASVSGCDDAGNESSESACGPSSGVVSRAVDGDTIELASGEQIRYLLVDTPESTSQVECYGEEAASFNASLVVGQDVELSYDQECTDRFGRTLAYVRLQGRDINALLVERGYACILHIPPNGEDRVDEFEDIEADAKARMVGMWGVCEEIGCE